MFSAIRIYEGCTDTDKLLEQVNGDLLPAIRDMDGFQTYEVHNCGDGRIISITKFDTEEQAEQANDEVSELVQKSLADLLPEPPDISVGELVLESRR
jgi:hypothetical protein